MFNSIYRNFIFVILVFWLSQIFDLPAQPPNSEQILNKDEIISLIPRSSDGPLDDEELARRQKLVNMGSKIYPVLCNELLKTDDVFLASHIISIIAEGHEDKTLPRQSITQLIRKWNSQSANGKALLGISAQVLGKIGTKEDTEILIFLLDDPASSVRVNSLRSLAKIGDEQTAQQIQTWLEARNSSMNTAEQRKDPSICEAEKAVAILQERIQKPALDK